MLESRHDVPCAQRTCCRPSTTPRAHPGVRAPLLTHWRVRRQWALTSQCPLLRHPTGTHIPQTPADPRSSGSTAPSSSSIQVVSMVLFAQPRMPTWKERAIGGWVGGRRDPLNTLAAIPQRLSRPAGGASLSSHHPHPHLQPQPPGAEQRAAGQRCC